MTVETAIATKVAAAAAVVALVSTRVYVLKLPQKPTLPAIRTQLVSEGEFYTHDGTSNIFRARVQVDAIAAEASGTDPYVSATDVGAAINAALSGFRGEIGGSPAFVMTGVMRADRRVGYDAEELRQVVCSQDYICWYRT